MAVRHRVPGPGPAVVKLVCRAELLSWGPVSCILYQLNSETRTTQFIMTIIISIQCHCLPNKVRSGDPLHLNIYTRCNRLQHCSTAALQPPWDKESHLVSGWSYSSALHGAVGRERLAADHYTAAKFSSPSKFIWSQNSSQGVMIGNGNNGDISA